MLQVLSRGLVLIYDEGLCSLRVSKQNNHTKLLCTETSTEAAQKLHKVVFFAYSSLNFWIYKYHEVISEARTNTWLENYRCTL